MDEKQTNNIPVPETQDLNFSELNKVQPATQSIPTQQTNTPDKKFITPKKLLFLVVLIVTAIPVIYVLYWVIIFATAFSGTDAKMDKLNEVAAQKEKTLNQLQIVSGQDVKAEGIVNGDWLTASKDPAQSTHATISYNVDATLAEIESQAMIKLKKAGYVRDGPESSPDLTPYYKYSSSYSGSKGSGTITFRYLKGEDAVRISYKFDQAYECPVGKICERTKSSKLTDDIYDVRAYATLKVTKLDITYADEDYYLVQL